MTGAEATRTTVAIVAARRILLPPPDLTVSEFADAEIRVTSGPRKGARWRTDFADGGVCRVSFDLSEVESMHGWAGICSTIRKKRVIQGRPDTYRIYANGGVVPNPRGDWD